MDVLCTQIMTFMLYVRVTGNVLLTVKWCRETCEITYISSLFQVSRNILLNNWLNCGIVTRKFLLNNFFLRLFGKSLYLNKYWGTKDGLKRHGVIYFCDLYIFANILFKAIVRDIWSSGLLLAISWRRFHILAGSLFSYSRETEYLDCTASL
jgi:hypothetical protein